MAKVPSESNQRKIETKADIDQSGSLNPDEKADLIFSLITKALPFISKKIKAALATLAIASFDDYGRKFDSYKEDACPKIKTVNPNTGEEVVISDTGESTIGSVIHVPQASRETREAIEYIYLNDKVERKGLKEPRYFDAIIDEYGEIPLNKNIE